MPRSAYFTVRMSEEDRDYIKERAEREGKSQTKVFEEILDKYAAIEDKLLEEIERELGIESEG